MMHYTRTDFIPVTSSVFQATPTAQAFTLTETNGEEITLPREHHSVDIYFFWATWCPYCKALMPHSSQNYITPEMAYFGLREMRKT